MNRIYFYKLFFVLFFLHFCSSLSSQNSYFIKDTTITYGSKNVDNNKSELNSRFCEIKDGDSIIRYTPYQVSEYGFDDERVFIAKKVQLPDSLQTVFLERLITGRMTLYYYKGQNYTTFFVSKDSTTLVELPRRNKTELPNFRKQLTELTAGCAPMEEASNLVVYNRSGMKEFFKRLNDCDSKPFSFLRYGFQLESNLYALIYPTILSPKNYLP